VAPALLHVVVDELLDVGLDEADLGEDRIGGRGPDEWLGVGVPGLDVVPDPADQGGDGRELTRYPAPSTRDTVNTGQLAG
jgi:hypothetical protein